MEHNEVEVKTVENAIASAVESDIRELNDLQMAVVGGGCGEVVFG